MTPYYEADGITIYHGDCLDVLPLLAPVDHVITDPPYSAYTHAKQWIGAALTDDGAPRIATAHASLGFDPLTPELMRGICRESRRLVRRWILVFCDLESISLWQERITVAGLEYVRACIWDKVDSAPQFTGDRPANSAEAIVVAHLPGKKTWNGGGARSVFRFAVNAERGAKPHPSTKPEPLLVELVNLFTDPGDLVLDPCMGSGTTLVACKRLGRRAIGIETSERYCAIAAERLAQAALPVFQPAPEAASLPW